MSVIIKGSGWKWASGKDDYAGTLGNSIELIPPTSEEIANLKVMDRVLVELPMRFTQDFSRVVVNGFLDLDNRIVSILSSQPKEVGLPQKVYDDCSGDVDIDELKTAVNEIIDYLKEKEREK